MPNEEIAAACTGLVKIYWSASGEVHALKGIDARFPAGEVTAIVGPSGSGKSSLLRIIGCIDRPTAGQVKIAELDVSAAGPTRRRAVRRKLIGYLFQRPSDNLVQHLSAGDQLKVAARLRGRYSAEEARGLLERLGLQGRDHHKPQQLSGGEQQRLGLATAVIGRPALVVADEPTAELDSQSGAALMQIVRSLADDGATFILSTHDPLVMRAADRIVHLRHGAMEAETRQDRILSVIDDSGRIQLPPQALKMFPGRRAVISLQDGEVKITPP